MTDLQTPPIEPNRSQPRSRRLTWIAVIALAAGLTAGAAVTTAFSRPGFGPMHWHGGGFMRGPMTPAQIEERADRMVRHLAIEVDASSDQQDKLRTIVRGAVRDVVPMRDKVHAARAQARKLLTEPAVNRAEIERLRAEQVALADQFSRRMAQAIGDAAEVLNAEQRKKLDDFLPPPGVPGPGRGWIR